MAEIDEFETRGRDEEALFARDENDALVRREKATREQFGIAVTVTIDGYAVRVPQAVPVTDAQGNKIRGADGQLVPRNSTIYDAALQLVDEGTWPDAWLRERIPLLCHQPHLHPVGVCRMCVVQIQQIKRGTARTERKLLPACHHAVAENMVVTTRAGWAGYNPEVKVPKADVVDEATRIARLETEVGKFATNIRDSVKTLADLLMADHTKQNLGPARRYVDELAEVGELVGGRADRPGFADPKGPPERNTAIDRRSRRLALPLAETAIEPEEGLGRDSANAWQQWNATVDEELPYSSRTVVVDHDRCILCDRCVRSCSEVKPFKVIGHTGKGYNTRISFDLDQIMGDSSCVQCGECMTSCPTGALSLRRRVKPRAWDDSPKLIPQNPNTPFPSESGFLTADEIQRIRIVHNSPILGRIVLYPFRTVPFAYLKWNEGAIRKWVLQPGESKVLCRQGEYGSTAFVLQGTGQFKITRHDDAIAETKSGWLGRLFNRDPKKKNGPERLIRTARGDELVLGEMACLTFRRRGASVEAFAPTDNPTLELAEDESGNEIPFFDQSKPGPVVVYEVTRNLLEMMRRSASTRSYVEEMYSLRALEDCIATGKVFQSLAPDERRAATDFLIASGKIELRRLEANQLIVAQGDAAGFFYIVRFGNLRVFETIDGNERPIRTLGDRDYFGELAILKKIRRTTSVAALDPSEVVMIPAELFNDFCARYPKFEAAILSHVYEPAVSGPATAGLLDEYLEQGLYQAQKMLVLDLKSCTRCDECTKACADSHDGNARLLREGLRFGDFLVATSCRSCHTPYCMDGCPVDAIHRRGNHLEVIIEDHCIGCGLCERNCPYGSIHMVGRDKPNLSAANFLEGNPSLIAAGPQHAVNCDLCNGGKPYCVEACPHDAAFRLDGPELLKRMSTRLNLL